MKWHRETTGRSRVLFVGMILVASLMTFLSDPPTTRALSNQIQITQPQLPSGEFNPIPNFYYPTLQVNVSSTIQLANVTLFYTIIPGPPSNISQYTKVTMSLVSKNDGNYTYQYHMPSFPDKTNVYGLARAVDVQGNTALSSSEPQQLYYVLTPSPTASFLLNLYPVDVNPRYLNMSIELAGSEVNTATYSTVTIRDYANGIYGPTLKQYAGCCWNSKFRYNGIFYWTGVPQLYPFDSYTYKLNLSLAGYPTNANVSFWAIGTNQPLKQGVVYQNFITFNPNSTKSRIDDSLFSLTSSVTFVPAVNSTYAPTVRVVMTITRQPDQSDFQILVPTSALYLFLGSSLILRRKDYVTNRLGVYVGVFIFAYTFALSLGSLTGTPLSFGYSMAERLGFALIPCAAILAFATMLGSTTENQKRRTEADILALIVSFFTLYEMSQFSIQYGGTYNLFSLGTLGWYGWTITLSLFTGALIVLGQIVRGRRKNPISNPIESEP